MKLRAENGSVKSAQINEVNTMNTLSKEDALLFHKLMNSLLFFVNKKTGIIKNATTLKDLFNRDIAETQPIRKKIFSDKYNFMDTYIRENPDTLNQEELKIIASWKKYETDKFIVIKHVKEYSLFFNPDNQKVYGVKGITDSFEEKFRGYAPVMVDITLIPFKEHLIYDGLFAPYNISFGGGIRSSLKQESEAAIQRFGIITDFLNGKPLSIYSFFSSSAVKWIRAAFLRSLLLIKLKYIFFQNALFLAHAGTPMIWCS